MRGQYQPGALVLVGASDRCDGRCDCRGDCDPPRVAAIVIERRFVVTGTVIVVATVIAAVVIIVTKTVVVAAIADCHGYRCDGYRCRRLSRPRLSLPRLSLPRLSRPRLSLPCAIVGVHDRVQLLLHTDPRVSGGERTGAGQQRGGENKQQQNVSSESPKRIGIDPLWSQYQIGEPEQTLKTRRSGWFRLGEGPRSLNWIQ